MTEPAPEAAARPEAPADGISTANATPKLRSRKHGAAIPLDDTDKRLMNLLQSSFPLDAEPFALLAAEADMPADELMERTQRLLDERIIREITPIFDTRALGYSSMLVAAKVDSENPQRAAKIINSHPGVSHNYLRTHEFNLWFTIATPPDSELGLEGTLDVLQRMTGAESIRELPTLILFKINMNLEMEGGTGDLAAPAAEPVVPRELEAQPYDERDVAVIKALQGPMRGDRPALRRGRRGGRDDDPGPALAPGRDGRPQAAAAGRRDPLPPPRRLLGQRHGRLARPRGRDHGGRDADGRGPRRLALLPAAHLRGLALQRLHDGPRPLEGGVRRDPRRDRRRARPARTGPGGALLLDRVQEGPPALLHGRLRRVGGGATLPDRRSASLYERAVQVLPGGVNSPVRAMRSIGRDPVFVERGEGPYIWDADGNRYVDWVCSWGPLILGHAHPAVVEAVAEAAGRGTSFGAATEGEV